MPRTDQQERPAEASRPKPRPQEPETAPQPVPIDPRVEPLEKR